MKKSIGKFLSIVLVLSMILTTVAIVPVSASAAEVDYSTIPYASLVDISQTVKGSDISASKTAAKGDKLFITDESGAASKTAHGNVKAASLNSMTAALDAAKTADGKGNNVFLAGGKYYQADGLLPTLEQGSDASYYDAINMQPYSATEGTKTFDLSGRYIKGVSLVMVSHSPNNKGAGAIIGYADGSKSSDDNCSSVPSFKFDSNTNPFLTGTQAGTETAYYLNYADVLADSAKPATLFSVHTSGQTAESARVNYKNINGVSDGDATSSHHAFLYADIAAVYEIEYSFNELTEVLNARIADYQTASEVQKEMIYSALLKTINSAKERGYDESVLTGWSNILDAPSGAGKKEEARENLLSKGVKIANPAGYTPNAIFANKDFADSTVESTLGTHTQTKVSAILTSGAFSNNYAAYVGDDSETDGFTALKGKISYALNGINYDVTGLVPQENAVLSFGANLFGHATTYSLNPDSIILKQIDAVYGSNGGSEIPMTFTMKDGSNGPSSFRTYTSKAAQTTQDNNNVTFASGYAAKVEGGKIAKDSAHAMNLGMVTLAKSENGNYIVPDTVSVNSAGKDRLTFMAVYAVKYGIAELADTVIPGALDEVIALRATDLSKANALKGYITNTMDDADAELAAAGYQFTLKDMLSDSALSKYDAVFPNEKDYMRVESASVENGTQASATTEKVVITMSNSISAESIANLANLVTVTGTDATVSAAANLITVDFGGILGYNKNVTVTVKAGMTDSVTAYPQHTLEQDYVLSFSTLATTEKLNVTASSVENRAEGVAPSTSAVTFTFNKPVNAEKLSSDMTVTVNGSKVEFTVQISGNDATVTLSKAPGHNKDVMFTIPAGFYSAEGFVMEDEYTLVFSTERKEVEATTLANDTFDSDEDIHNWSFKGNIVEPEIVSDPFDANSTNKVLKITGNPNGSTSMTFARILEDNEDYAGKIYVSYKFGWFDTTKTSGSNAYSTFMNLKDSNGKLLNYMGFGGQGLVRIFDTSAVKGGEVQGKFDLRQPEQGKFLKVSYVFDTVEKTITYSINGGESVTRYLESYPYTANTFAFLETSMSASASADYQTVIYLDDVKIAKCEETSIIDNIAEKQNPDENITLSSNMKIESFAVTVKDANGTVITQDAALNDTGRVLTVETKGLLKYNQTYTLEYELQTEFGEVIKNTRTFKTYPAKTLNFIGSIEVTQNGNGFDASFTIKNPENTQKGAWVVIAAFNENNKMLKLVSGSYEVPANGNTPGTLSLTDVPTGTKFVRAFMWD